MADIVVKGRYAALPGGGYRELTSSFAPRPAPRLVPGFTATRGGAGGTEIRVTTLAATGPGSLGEALAATGPRTIRFDVAGLIDFTGSTVTVTSPYVTVDASTAPSPGVTIIKGGLVFHTHNVVVRHLRVRVGWAGNTPGAGWTSDALSTENATDVIFDHCSLAWGTDEIMSTSGPRFGGTTPAEWRRSTSHRVSFYRCIVAEGMGVNSFGTLVHDNVTDVAIIGCLYISNRHRQPYVKGGATVVISNNIIHNFGARAMQFALGTDQWVGQPYQRGLVSIVGNVVQQGPSSTLGIAAQFGLRDYPSVPLFDVHLHDNVFRDQAGHPQGFPIEVIFDGDAVTNYEGTGFALAENPPVWPESFTPLPSDTLVATLLPDVGARPWDRDAVDTRLVMEATTGGGAIIAHEDEVGGYGVLAA